MGMVYWSNDNDGRKQSNSVLVLFGVFGGGFHNRHMKVVKVVSPMHRPPLPPRNTPGTHFCYEAESMPEPQCSRKDYINK